VPPATHSSSRGSRAAARTRRWGPRQPRVCRVPRPPGWADPPVRSGFHQELDRTGPPEFLGWAGDGIGLPFDAVSQTDHRGLARGKRKPATGRVEPEEDRARCLADDVTNREVLGRHCARARADGWRVRPACAFWRPCPRTSACRRPGAAPRTSRRRRGRRQPDADRQPHAEQVAHAETHGLDGLLQLDAFGRGLVGAEIGQQNDELVAPVLTQMS